MTMLLLLVAVYCCCFVVGPSIDVIKNRKGMHFNQQLRKKGGDACVSRYFRHHYKTLHQQAYLTV